MTLRLHPEAYRTYVVDRNINYANYCTAKCIFCNFKADPPGMSSGRKDLPDGYVLSLDEIGRKIAELEAIGGTQVLMQGGLVPADVLSFDWYLDLMRFIKRESLKSISTCRWPSVITPLPVMGRGEARNGS